MMIAVYQQEIVPPHAYAAEWGDGSRDEIKTEESISVRWEMAHGYYPH